MSAATKLGSRALLGALLFVCASIIGRAQQENQPAKTEPSKASKSETSLVLKTTVRRVVVDVVVTDSAGKPVRGLTADDFSVAEDGKAQRVRSFDVHDFDPVSASLPTSPALPTNTFMNLPPWEERGPLYVLLLDLLNIDVADQPAARVQLLQFIRKKPLGARFAIFMLTDGLHLVQGFTQDRNVLTEVLDSKTPHSRIPRIFLYADNYRPYVSTPQILTAIGNYLAALPGHKNLIWLSGSFPSGMFPGSNPQTEALSVNKEIEEATDTLARGEIAVYPVDVRGVVVTSPSASAPGSENGNMDGSAPDQMVNAANMTEAEIAYATGGRAFYNTNDIASSLFEATELGGRYYTLTYSPSNEKYDGHARHIHVELDRRGYHLSYRHSYYGTINSSGNPSTPHIAGDTHLAAELEPLALSKAADSLAPNMQHGAPLAHQLLFRAHVHSLAPPAKATREQIAKLVNQLALHSGRKQESTKASRSLELQTYQIDYTVAARYPTLEFAAVAYDSDGKMLNATVQRVVEGHSAMPDPAASEGIYRIQQKFDVPTTAASIRLAVRDVSTDNVGALELNLPLPVETESASASMPASTSAPDSADPPHRR